MEPKYEEYKFANGDYYLGEMKYGYPDGKGKMSYANGDSYVGGWKEGRQNGLGKYTFADGIIYECNWVNGKKHGKGRVTYSSGKVVEREWVDDKPVTKACYVATAVYGSYDCPEVWTLRRFRDFSLAKNIYGRVFIKLYYAISPTLVKWFGKNKWFKTFCKKHLDEFVRKLKSQGYNDTPYND